MGSNSQLTVSSSDVVSNSVRFQSGEAMGVALIAVGSALSTLAILVVLIRVAIAALRPLVQGLKGRRDSKESVFFHTQLGIYAICLLVANLLSSFAGLIELSWMTQDGISAGALCNTQAALFQIGDFAGAYFATAISIHTFNTLVIQKRSPLWFTGLVIFAGWMTSILLGTVIQVLNQPSEGPYFGSVGLWCWISKPYPMSRFLFHYLPIILCAIITVVMYSLIFLCIRGTLVIGGGIRLNLSGKSLRGWPGRLDDMSERYSTFLGAIARSMVWYPLAFITLLMPISAVRLMDISGIDVSNTAFAVAGIVASLLGLANVIILSNTLRILGPAFSGPASTGAPDVESFFCPGKDSPTDEKPSQGLPAPTAHTSRSFPQAPISRSASPAPPPYLGSAASSFKTSFDRPRSPSNLKFAISSHQRPDSQSTDSSSIYSRRLLLDPRAGRLVSHASSVSIDSVVTVASLQQHIIPAQTLKSALIARPEPAVHNPVASVGLRLSSRQEDPRLSGLTPPPRQNRSSIARQPSLESFASARSSAALRPRSAEFEDVELASPPASTGGRRRSPLHMGHDSLISLYVQYSEITPGADKKQRSNGRVRPATSAVAVAPPPVPAIRTAPRRAPPVPSPPPSPPSNGESSDYSSGSDEPASPKVLHLSRSDTHVHDESLRKQVRDRTLTLRAEGGGLSSLAWASLVTNAALGDGVSRSSSLKTTQGDRGEGGGGGLQRDRSVSSIPKSLQPRTPGSAYTTHSFFEHDGEDEVPDVPSLPTSPGTERTMHAIAGDPSATMRSGPRRTAMPAGSQQDAFASAPFRFHKQRGAQPPGYI